MKPVNWNDPDLIGKKIIEKRSPSEPVEFLGVGKEMVFIRLSNGREIAVFKDLNWYYYEEPKRKEERKINKELKNETSKLE